jgi:hypothetical protein
MPIRAVRATWRAALPASPVAAASFVEAAEGADMGPEDAELPLQPATPRIKAAAQAASQRV